jgi:two-component system, NtrC family, sensor kinase
MSVATILVVEDDPLQMDMLEMILTRHAMTILRASTGEAALELYQQHAEIDLVLLDVMLPGQLDGIAVCRRLRADQHRLYVPIIMVTALGKTEQLIQGLDTGADDYITKPFSSRELMARLQAGLRVRRTQRDLAETQSRYRLLVETARDLIFVLDVRRQLTYVSPMSETLTGYPPEALLADRLPFTSFIHPDDAQRLAEWHAQLADHPDGSDLELRIRRADGGLRWGALSWITMYNREGSPSGVQGTIRDVTHRKAVEAATWRRSQELAALNLIAARLNQSLQLNMTLADALHALLEVVDAEVGAIYEIHQRQAILRAADGLPEADARRLSGPHAYARWQSSDLDIVREAADDTRGQIEAQLKALGIQVVVTVPLRERGEIIGLLILASRAIDKFEATEVTLISTVAEQISAAMANARLFEEAQHRAEELSILYDVGHMLTSTLDLAKVLRVIMEAAVSMLHVEAGSVLLLDEGTQELEFVAAVGAGSDHIMGLRLPAGAGIAGQALSEGRSLLIDEAQYNPSFYEAVDRVTGLNTRRLIATPLRVKERFIGVMEVINKRSGPFTAADLRMLDLLAPTAAAAIDNARLYARETQLTEEVRRHNQELSALHAISAALSQSLEIQDVLDAALLVLQPQIAYDGGYICLNGDATTPPAQAQHAPSDGIPLAEFRPIIMDVVEHAIATRAVCVLPNTAQLDQEAAAWSAAHIGAFAAVPLWGHDVVQGGLAIAWRQPRSFDQATVQLLAAIGQQIGVALERAALYDVAQRRAREIERSYAQLVQSEKLAATGRLALSLAHEINNPLQAIQNCLHLVLELPLPEERKSDYLKMAREEVERLSILVQSMLDFYRPARGGQQAAEVRTVLERGLALADQKLRSNQVETILHCPAESPSVQAPADQLGQVCLNLIMNAAEAMDQGGTLRIDVEPVDQMIEIRFRDTGAGIPPEVVAHIFEPFYTTKEEGTGLGLAISYTLIEQQGGTMQVESEVGRGTLFTIRLPRADELGQKTA